MSSLPHGENTSAIEVTNISAHGLWLLAHGREFFIPFKSFPWFKDQTIKSITNVVEQSPSHFYWPDLDIDLTEEIIEHPEYYPLIADPEHN
jgi:hypothetical protein